MTKINEMALADHVGARRSIPHTAINSKYMSTVTPTCHLERILSIVVGCELVALDVDDSSAVVAAESLGDAVL
jgi:hypothetical protein